MPARLPGSDTAPVELPLFPLKTVLYPGGRLALRIFEQRYLAMAKSRLSGDSAFGICLITDGDEVATPGTGGAPSFAMVGTAATIRAWDMPQLGILQVRVEGGERFRVVSHVVLPDGLVAARTQPFASERSVPLPDAYRPLSRLLEAIAERLGPARFPAERAFDDAGWVGFRLAEALPLPIALKQRLLEIDDATARLAALEHAIEERGLV